MSDPSSPPAAPIPIRPTGTANDATRGLNGSAGQVAGAEPDWTDQVADLVVDTVDKVRDKTTGPIISGARWVVFGIVAAIVMVPLAVMGIILIGRLLDLLPGELWIAYAALGFVLVVVGMLFWRMRRPR
jgi:hypothetical protein